MTNEFASFQVSLKVMLHWEGKILLLRKADLEDIDLPGGRMNAQEQMTPFGDVLRREIAEELGEQISYTLGKVGFVYRVRQKRYRTYYLVIVYEGDYLGGEIQLSDEHKRYEWIEKRTYHPNRKDFYAGDEEKYLAFQKYFEK